MHHPKYRGHTQQGRTSANAKGVAFHAFNARGAIALGRQHVGFRGEGATLADAMSVGEPGVSDG